MITITQDFLTIVENDVRNLSKSSDRKLLESEIDSWRHCLIEIKKDVETQLAAQNAQLHKKYTEFLNGTISESDYYAASADISYKKVSKLRFLQAVESKLSMIKLTKRQASDMDSNNIQITKINDAQKANISSAQTNNSQLN